MEKFHHQIRLRILSCSRMSENHRGLEVPEVNAPAVECHDGLARITLRGTCNNSFCEKWHPPECLFYKTKSGCRFGVKCSCAHRQVDEQPTKRSKTNNDKSAVAMLKNYTTIGFHMSRYGAAEVFIDFAEELKHTETNPMCSIH